MCIRNISLYVIIAGLCVITKQEAYGQPKTTGQQFSKLVWSDEFDYAGLPDTSKWQYEQGFVRGSESQLYTSGRLENAIVKKGCLMITARKELIENPTFLKNKQKGSLAKYPEKYQGVVKDSIPATVRNKFDSVANYTSASLITLGKASWLYGRLEVKAKLPPGKGLWPAIWMMGINRSDVGWPNCGEIDVMEHVGKDPSNIHATIHYKDEQSGKKTKNGSRIKVKNLYDDFHIYSVEWDSTAIRFFYDSNVYYTFNVSEAGNDSNNPFRKPFYLLINLAVGGSWGGAIDDSALPGEFAIDYVRFYQ